MIFLTSLVPLMHTIKVNNLYVDTKSDNLLRTNDKELYKKMTHKVSFYRKFGTYPTYVKHLLQGKQFGDKETVSRKQFLEYFSTYIPFEKSEFWGKDNGNNLIVVMLESIEEFLIHEKYTPTLYSLRKEGINFDNFYNTGYTESAETSVINGSYTTTRDIWDDKIGDVVRVEETKPYFFSVPNLLKRNGFDTANYFHPADGEIFSRNKTHVNDFGFDKALFLQDYDVMTMAPEGDSFNYRRNWGYPEEWFLKLAKDQFLPANKRFFSFFTTINTHGGYGPSSNPELNRAINKISNDDFPDIRNASYFNLFKNALGKAMLVDNGIKYLMQELKTSKLHCKTTILFYTDHTAYSDGLDAHMKSYTHTQSPFYNIPAFIYSPKVKGITMDKFLTTFDLVPTLLDLLGIEVNSRFYMGYNVFTSDFISIKYAPNGSSFNDKFFTYDGIEKTWQSTGATSTDFRIFQTEFLKNVERMRYFRVLYHKKTNTELIEDYLQNTS